MSRFYRLTALSVLIVAACLWFVVVPSNAKDDKDLPAKSDNQAKPGLKKLALKAFMRKKLESSQSIIEGLALENFELIEKGAKELKGMSAAADFMVSNDPIYKEHADDFRRVVIKMERAAKEKRIDGATLGFMDMTMNCVECHKYARTILVAQ
jgi:hypothetical protein